MVEPAALHPLAGQEIDQLLAEAQLHERDALVDVVERAAQQVDVEALGGGLVPHPQHQVVQAERLEPPAHRRHPTATSPSTPASRLTPFSTLESRCSRAKAMDSLETVPAAGGARCTASRAAWAAGSTTSHA